MNLLSLYPLSSRREEPSQEEGQDQEDEQVCQARQPGQQLGPPLRFVVGSHGDVILARQEQEESLQR